MIDNKTEAVIYEKKDGIAYVTLNRPDRFNAVNQRMQDDLKYIWEDVRDDRSIKVGIITGAGKAFCGGRDLKDAAQGRETTFRDSFRPYRYSSNTPLSPKAHYVFKPIIVAVNGVCAPYGLEFVAEGDIIIGSDKATFVDTHVTVGVMVHSAMALSRRIGYNHVMRMALMGSHERMDAAKAERIGLLTEVTTPEKLMPRAEEIAKTIMRNSPAAVQASVEAMWHGLSLGLRDAIQMDVYMQKLYNTHPDALEGAKAFAEKREPKWNS